MSFFKVSWNELPEPCVQRETAALLEDVMEIEVSAREIFRRKQRSWRQKAILNAMETRLVLESDKLQGRLAYISMIAKIALLLGILGTSVGIIETFESLAHSRRWQGPRLLPSGIQKSLITTWIGLSIAIPAQVFYLFLANRATRMTLEVNLVVKDLMARFTDPD